MNANKSSHPQYLPAFLSAGVRPPNTLTPSFPLRLAGTWDPLLQCLYLDTPVLEQQNTEKLYGTENASLPIWANSRPKRYKETKKTNYHFFPTTTFEDPGAKTGGGEQKQGTAHAPCILHHLRSGQTT